MKLEFLTPVEKSKNLLDLIGKTDADIDKLQEEFNDAIENGSLRRPIDVVVWCADKADTIEETLIYTMMALDSLS